jgi:hypothetical protein
MACRLRPWYPARSCSSSAGEPVTRSRTRVAWLSSSDTLHLAGYGIGAADVQGTLFSRTMPGEFVSLADGQVSSGTRGFPLPGPFCDREGHANPDGVDESLGNLLVRPRTARPGPFRAGACKGDNRLRLQTRDELAV